MDSSQESKCNQCLQMFTTNNLPLKMVYCCHNICQRCFAEVQQSTQDIVQCQFCGSTVVQCKNKKLEINKNLIIKIISPKKKDETGNDTTLSFNTNSHKYEKNFAHTEQNQILLMEDDIALTRKKSLGNIQMGERKKIEQICPLHEKPLEIICLTDLKRICPHCAIFGTHQDHKFKSLKEFDQDLNNNLRSLQMLKQRKYKLDKKNKTWEYNDGIMKKIRSKQDQLRNQIEKKFGRLVNNIKSLEKKMIDDLTDNFKTIENRINSFLMDDSQNENKYMNWELQCQNHLNRIHQNISLNEKISIMYGPLVDMKEGEKLLTQMEKKVDVVNMKIEDQINTIKFQFNENIKLAELGKVYVSNEKKESFISNIQKVNFPMSKHILDEISDFTDNSFICDYSKEDLSAFIEDPKKTPVKKNRGNLKNSTGGVKFASPDLKKISAKMIRSKSNNNLNIPSVETTIDRKRTYNRALESSHSRKPEEIIADFLSNDLKDVLDLSHCNLTDEKAFEYLKEVRRHRRIRGLKLNKNMLTDQGFSKMLDLFSTTSNLNLAGNILTDDCLSLILKYRQKFSPLRIVNFSGNKFNDKKAKGKVEQMKKIRIIVTL